MSKPTILILVAFTLVAISAGRLVGGRMHMGDVTSNKEVQELGRFCVHHYNRMIRLISRNEEAPLRFVKVVEAETQVVAGIKYYLKVEVLQGPEKRLFDAQVVVKPGLNTSKHLLSFSPSTKPLY